MPRDRPTPPPFEPEWLDRSLDRYLTVGLVAMLVLIGGFLLYKVREPSLRAEAAVAQERSYRSIGGELFATTCASCHGAAGTGGGAPTLNSTEFLAATTDSQIQDLVTVGIPGTDMSAWGLDQGGTLTDEQIHQISTYLRSLEASAPSVPDWRRGAKASAR